MITTQLTKKTDALFVTQTGDSQKPDSLEEFVRLGESAGFNFVDHIDLPFKPKDRYYIGTGKLAEIADLCVASNIDVVLFDLELSASRKLHFEKTTACTILDRTEIILNIFADRAQTHEGKIQIQIAQIEYESKQLVRHWSHLDRQKGGIGLRGAGEKQLELDQRLLTQKLMSLRKKLNKIRNRRDLSRQTRARKGLFTISLVGYTNAGKSSLFQTLTNNYAYVEDKPFATLDPKFRSLNIPGLGAVILTDTVGFIKDLPPQLLDAFKATLEEIQNSDLLIHVVDSSYPKWQERILQVNEILTGIMQEQKPCITVMNKLDLLKATDSTVDSLDNNQSIAVSSLTGAGLPTLLDSIAANLSGPWVQNRILLQPSQGGIRASLYKLQVVVEEKITPLGSHDMMLRLPTDTWLKLKPGLLASGGKILALHANV